MMTIKKLAALLALAVSTSLLSLPVAHAAPPSKKMAKMSAKMGAKPKKAMPMRDAKGRFIKKSAAPMMAKAPHKMPMRDAKGRFIKSAPGAMTTHKK